MAVELRIPSAGESITEVQIGEWLKAEGDFVDRDEVIVEIETDKASMELPSPVRGVVQKHLKQAGEIVGIGEVIALIEEGGTAAAPSRSGTETAKTATGAAQKQGATAGSNGGSRVMPAAQRALAEAGLQPSEVQATGPGGRLLKEDVERHVAERAAAPAPKEAPAAPAATTSSTPVGERHEEAVPMTMLRRRIAQRLVEAKQSMAMLTTFNEVDLSAVLKIRAERNEEFQKRHGTKLGIMSFFVKAAIDALKLFPAVNAEIRGADLIYKNYYDIGVAVSTDQGLVVPVVRNAERLSFAEVEAAIGDLAKRARDRKITVEELQGGTFTITNGGVFGSLLATPIINPPQSAILGLHAIKERPIAENGQVVIRPMMYIALTYDHRIIDGRESVTFLRRIKECVEDPTRMLIEG